MCEISLFFIFKHWIFGGILASISWYISGKIINRLTKKWLVKGKIYE